MDFGERRKGDGAYYSSLQYNLMDGGMVDGYQ